MSTSSEEIHAIRSGIMTTMFNKKEGSDIVIEVGDPADPSDEASQAKRSRIDSTDSESDVSRAATERFHVHSFVLQTFSPCLLALVDSMTASQARQPGDRKVARLQDFSVDVVGAFLKLLYGFDWADILSYDDEDCDYEVLKGLLSMAHRYETKFAIDQTARKIIKLCYISHETAFELFESGFMFEVASLKDAVVKHLIKTVPDRFIDITTKINKTEWVALKKRNPSASTALLEECGEKWARGKLCPICKHLLSTRCTNCGNGLCHYEECNEKAMRIRCKQHENK